MMDVQFGVLNYLLSLVGIEPLLWLADDRTALPAIMLIDIWQSSMFVFILMYAGILSLPQDPYEAAAIDGASPWQIFRDVTIPLLRPTFVVILLLRTLDAARIADRDAGHDARRSRLIHRDRRTIDLQICVHPLQFRVCLGPLGHVSSLPDHPGDVLHSAHPAHVGVS